MSIRKISFVPNEYYHIYNRGNSKQIIFHDESDYIRFIKLLFLSNSEFNFKVHLIDANIFSVDQGEKLVSIGVYCLMPNHFHLLISQTENGSISKFMQKLTTAYSMYYNKKYKRTGALFEGKFKAEHVSDERYLKYLFSYIHLNPIKLIDSQWKEKGIKDIQKTIELLNTYEYSSYFEYSERNRLEQVILNREVFPDYFSTKEKHNKEIFEWLSYRE